MQVLKNSFHDKSWLSDRKYANRPETVNYIAERGHNSAIVISIERLVVSHGQYFQLAQTPSL
jgi:hypothetical protein